MGLIVIACNRNHITFQGEAHGSRTRSDQLRDRIIHLEGQVAFLYKHLGVTFIPEAAPGDDPGIIEHLKNGNLLEAIKIHRGITGASYEEGKKAVEEMKARLGI